MTVLYDRDCPLCVRAHRFLLGQPKYVPIEFVPAGSPRAVALFPQLEPAATLRDLTVIGDGGEVYRGENAFVICLWALKRYRGISLSIAASDRGAARRVFALISRNRRRISGWLGLE